MSPTNNRVKRNIASTPVRPRLAITPTPPPKPQPRPKVEVRKPSRDELMAQLDRDVAIAKWLTISLICIQFGVFLGIMIAG